MASGPEIPFQDDLYSNPNLVRLRLKLDHSKLKNQIEVYQKVSTAEKLLTWATYWRFGKFIKEPSFDNLTILGGFTVAKVVFGQLKQEVESRNQRSRENIRNYYTAQEMNL